MQCVNDLKSLILFFIFILSFIISGCGDDNKSVPINTLNPSVSNVSGLVEAPGGAIAQHKNINNGFFSGFINHAYAAITGLAPVTNASVVLIRIDDNGVQVGNTIAETTTDDDGRYSFSLSSSVDLSGNLIVEIQSGNSQMRAIAIGEEVDINPVTHVVLQTLIDSPLALASLSVKQIDALTDKVSRIDLTDTPSFNDAIDKLASDGVIDVIKNEIVSIGNGIGNSENAEGNWYVISKVNKFVDNENGQNAIAHGQNDIAIDTSWFTITSQNEGLIQATENKYIEIGANYFSTFAENMLSNEINPFHHYFSPENPDNSDPSNDQTSENLEVLTLSIDGENNLHQTLEFAEILGRFDNDEPHIGRQIGATSMILYSAGNDNIKFGTLRNQIREYHTTDTDNDGKKDAIDLSSKIGDTAFSLLNVAMKTPDNLTADVFNGNYGVVSVYDFLNPLEHTTQFGAFTVLANFDGVGNITIPENTLDEITITRHAIVSDAQLTAELNVTHITENEANSFSYVVDESEYGGLNFSDESKGYSSDDGKLIVKQKDITGEFEFEQEFSLLTKLGDAAPELNNTSYKLIAIKKGVNALGLQQLMNISSDSKITFNDNQATISSTVTGYERDNEVAQIRTISGNKETLTFSMELSQNGEILLNATNADTSINMNGFVAEDASYILLKAHAYNTQAPNEHQAIGLVIAIKSSS